MTQEELDSLMSQDVDLLNSELNVADDSVEDKDTSVSEEERVAPEFVDPNSYRPEADKKWPPPPPTEEHKVVHQLDDVTRDSEVKMTEVFDQIEIVADSVAKIEKKVKSVKDYLKKQEEMLKTLAEKFPKIQAFSASLDETAKINEVLVEINNLAMDCSDACMQTMDIMQYQDIHRQKIERVINVMRALSQYMNSLFEGKVDDSRRVSSATYIAGDNHDEVASESDIEALIASFGK